jgi:hypothetical protein
MGMEEDEDEDEQEGDGEEGAAGPEQAGHAAASFQAYRRHLGRAAIAGGQLVGGEGGELLGEIGEGMVDAKDGKPGFARRRVANKLGTKAGQLYQKRAIAALRTLRGEAHRKAMNRIEMNSAALSGAVAGLLRGEDLKGIVVSAAGAVIRNRRIKWVLMVIKGGSALTLYGIVITWGTIAIQLYFGNYKKKWWCPKITWWPEGIVWAVVSFLVGLILFIITILGIVLIDLLICVGRFTPLGILSGILQGDLSGMGCASKYLEIGSFIFREIINSLRGIFS